MSSKLMSSDYAIAIIINGEENYLLKVKERSYSEDLEDAYLFKDIKDIPELLKDEYVVEVGGVFEYGDRTRYVRKKVLI